MKPLNQWNRYEKRWFVSNILITAGFLGYSIYLINTPSISKFFGIPVMLILMLWMLSIVKNNLNHAEMLDYAMTKQKDEGQ